MKSIFASKTFWLNVIGTAATFTPFFPPKVAMVAMPALNIANRFLTSDSVNLTGN